jgi:hypothetical protein
MRKVIVDEFVSLDGIMQAPGSPDEDRSGGFEQAPGSSPTSTTSLGSSQRPLRCKGVKVARLFEC